jgi:hypothetical protein
VIEKIVFGSWKPDSTVEFSLKCADQKRIGVELLKQRTHARGDEVFA